MTSTLETDLQNLGVGISNNEDVEVVELPVDQWYLLEEAFAHHECPMPDPNQTAILAAVENGKILGFVPLQVYLHAEPLVIYPEAEHRNIWKLLYDKIDEKLPDGTIYIITTDRPAIGRRALSRGFIEIGKSFGKLVTKEQ